MICGGCWCWVVGIFDHYDISTFFIKIMPTVSDGDGSC